MNNQAQHWQRAGLTTVYTNRMHYGLKQKCGA